MPERQNMSDKDKPRPELHEENWERGETKVVIEGDQMRVIVELVPRVEGVEPTTFEFFTRPF
jgi:hypothetical protein